MFLVNRGWLGPGFVYFCPGLVYFNPGPFYFALVVINSALGMLRLGLHLFVLSLALLSLTLALFNCLAMAGDDNMALEGDDKDDRRSTMRIHHNPNFIRRHFGSSTFRRCFLPPRCCFRVPWLLQSTRVCFK